MHTTIILVYFIFQVTTRQTLTAVNLMERLFPNDRQEVMDEANVNTDVEAETERDVKMQA